jgi:hypothetical protein
MRNTENSDTHESQAERPIYNSVTIFDIHEQGKKKCDDASRYKSYIMKNEIDSHDTLILPE